MNFSLTILFFIGTSLISFARETESEFRKKLDFWSNDDLAGQLLFVGIRSVKHVLDIKPGGVLLFGWNMRDVEHTQKLTSELSALDKKMKLPLVIATDHEGGEVIRIRKGVTNFPDAAVIAANNNPKLAEEIGFRKGKELIALGINTNLAPVLDLGNSKSFLRNRVWGSDPEKVSELTSAYIAGLERAGILSVAKHFPGHGSTTTDAHFKLPIIYKTIYDLQRADLKPFRQAINDNVPALMTAHVELPRIERGPASMSKTLLSKLLRDDMGYEGVIITDDLEMGGAQGKNEDVENLALKALDAGSDMVMLVWNFEHQQRVKKAFKTALENGRLPKSVIKEKIVRIWKAKQRFLNTKTMRNPDLALGSNDTRVLVEQAIYDAVKWRAGSQNDILNPFRNHKRESWQVWLPSKTAKNIWKQFRPQDELRLFNFSQSSDFISVMNKSIDQNKPLIFVTPPRSGIHAESFQKLLAWLSEKNKQDKPLPLLWVHQGTDPIPVRKQDAEELRFGIMTLSSASRRSLLALTTFLDKAKLR